MGGTCFVTLGVFLGVFVGFIDFFFYQNQRNSAVVGPSRKLHF